MTTPPGPGFPGGFQGQPGQPSQPGYSGQPGQFGQPQQFPQAPGFPPGTGQLPPNVGQPGQPQQFPQAPMGTPQQPKKRWVRYVVAPLSGLLVIGGIIVVKIVIGMGVGAAVDSTNDAHNTAVGECATVTGTTSKPNYQKVDCGSGKQNYTVGSVLSSSSAKCPDNYDEYYETNAINPVKLCLIPVFADGACYQLDSGTTQMGYPKVDCTATKAVKVKVIKDKADKTACGADGADTALVYAETKTTICLTAPTGS